MKAWQYRALPIEERILARIEQRDDGCHEFTGAKDTDGYGRVKDSGVGVAVHRWMWERKNGPIPSGKHVLHSCDNPACVNVNHLHLGTHDDNMREKAMRGRSSNVPRGAAHKRPNAKLTESQVREIKALLRRGYRQADIARDFKVSRMILSDIATGRTWTHVE